MLTAKFVLSLMAAIHPQAPQTGNAGAVADAIARVVTEARELPADWSQEFTASVLVVTGWDESRYRQDAEDPVRHARCWAQIEGHPEVARSPYVCARVALAIMVDSARRCPEFPLAGYAGACRSRASRAISTGRIDKAWAVLGAVEWLTASH